MVNHKSQKMDGAALFILVNVIFALINLFAYMASKLYAEVATKAREEVIKERDQLEKDSLVFKELIAENNRLIQEIESKYAEPPQVKIGFVDENIIASQNRQWVKDQRELFAKMSYDDFADWLDQGNIQELIESAPYFEMANLPDHAEIIKAYLKNKGVK